MKHAFFINTVVLDVFRGAEFLEVAHELSDSLADAAQNNG
jgi:hypothetical protein